MTHVNGLTRDEAEHLLDSFSVMRKYEARDHGSPHQTPGPEVLRLDGRC